MSSCRWLLYFRIWLLHSVLSYAKKRPNEYNQTRSFVARFILFHFHMLCCFFTSTLDFFFVYVCAYLHVIVLILDAIS